MASLRELREEIKEAERDREFHLQCKITDEQYQVLEAIRSRNLDRFKSLIDKGINPYFRNDIGDTPAHIISALSNSQVTCQMLSVLVYLGVPLNVSDRFGQTPLHLAAERSAEAVRILLEGGANIDIQDNGGRSALMHACNSSEEKCDTLTVVNYLMDRDCNIFLKDADGQTALHCICQSKQPLIIRKELAYLLLYRGLSAAVPDKRGNIALCLEIERYVNRRGILPENALSVVEILIKAGSNFSVKNQIQHRMIKNTLSRASELYATKLAVKFEEVLSLTAIKKLKSLIPKDDHDKLRFYLNSLSGRVQSLKFLSRLAIRQELKGKVLVKVDLLPLPSSLKQYLLLEE